MHSDGLALRETVCRSANLVKAFNRFRRYRGLWATGVPMWRVAQDPLEAVLALADELRSDRYRPQAPHVVSIAKANGDRRELRIYAIRDRVVQRAVLQVLQQRTEPAMSPNSFGYRPGRSVGGAIKRVREFLARGLHWVVDADIERCFDSIPRQDLLVEVARCLGDCAAGELVAQCLGWDSPSECMRIGIPQGAVLTPWLCNVYLWHLDEQMRRRGTAMVRFADDFVLLDATRRGAETSKAFCDRAVQALGLRLHPLKTWIVDPATPFLFLGQWLAAPGTAFQSGVETYAAFH